MPDPLAYFITFRTYGTWLPGDQREYVDRRTNTWDTPLAVRHSIRERQAREALRASPLILDDTMRQHVEAAIRETCDYRGWTLGAVNARTNHVHVVVSASATPERVMTDLKAYATRRLVVAGAVTRGRPVWSRHGSTRWLFTASDLDGACTYTLEAQ